MEAIVSEPGMTVWRLSLVQLHVPCLLLLLRKSHYDHSSYSYSLFYKCDYKKCAITCYVGA